MTSERLRPWRGACSTRRRSTIARTLGEKAIGVLAYQQLGGRCEFVSRPEGSVETGVLRLDRGRVNALLERERRRARTVPGTTVYISDLDPDVSARSDAAKVVDYLRLRRGPALGTWRLHDRGGRGSDLTPCPSRKTGWYPPCDLSKVDALGQDRVRSRTSPRPMAGADASPLWAAPERPSSMTFRSSMSSRPVRGPPTRWSGQIVFESCNRAPAGGPFSGIVKPFRYLSKRCGP